MYKVPLLRPLKQQHKIINQIKKKKKTQDGCLVMLYTLAILFRTIIGRLKHVVFRIVTIAWVVSKAYSVRNKNIYV